MAESIPRPGALFKAALICAGAALAVVGVAWLDGSDGKVRIRRSGVVRFADDPTAFRGALVLNYGLPGVMFSVGAFALAMGEVGLHLNQGKAE